MKFTWPLVAATVFLQAFSGCSSPLPEPPKALERQVSTITQRLIRAHFPELEPVTITYVAATENLDSAFLETDVSTTTVFRSSRDRQYLIYINDRLLKNSPGPAALEAILAHELCHIQDFVRMSGWGLIRLYLNVNYDDHFEVKYERETDVCALDLGYADGLKAYRRWLYRTVSDPDIVALKQKVSFTPDQIDAWIASRRPTEE